MGEKGGWLSAFKKAFSPHSKPKLINSSSEKRIPKEKKKKKGFSKFRPLFREPSSIEEILDEAEREHNLVFRPPSTSDRNRTSYIIPKSPPKSAIAVTPPVSPSPEIPPAKILLAPEVASARNHVATETASAKKLVATETTSAKKPAATETASAKKPAATETASAKKPAATETASAKKPVATEIASSKKPVAPEIEPVPLKNNTSATPRSQHDSAIKIQSLYRGYMARKSFRVRKGTIRLHRDMLGQSVKRQTSNALKTMQLMVKLQSQIQSRRIQTLDAHSRLDGHMKESESSFGKWSLASEAGNIEWNDSLLTRDQVEARLRRKADGIARRERAMSYAYSSQKTKATKANRVPPWLRFVERHIHLPAEREDAPTPRSTRSAATFAQGKYSKSSGKLRSRARGGESPKDDDSLVSCPPFNPRRHYMSPTASTIAKARANSNPRETPPADVRRLSFPLAQGVVNSSPRPNSSASSDFSERRPFNRFV